MLPEHVAALCSLKAVEDTLGLLFHLNHWAKARDRLLYVDRQGLYQVKARLLQEAHAQGRVQASAYVAGPAVFDPFAEFYWDGWRGLMEDQLSGALHYKDDAEREQGLYEAATGRGLEEPLDFDAVEEYVRRRLEQLRQEAVEKRRPIDWRELHALLVLPEHVDLERFTQSRFLTEWQDLDDRDLAVLDPEGYSLVEIRYASPTARFKFHLPYRVAAEFVPRETLAQLQAGDEGQRREAGEFFGREITQEESLAHPVEGLLAELDVAIGLVCPKRLVDKGEHVAQIERDRAQRWAWRQAMEEYDEWDEDWDDEL
jgi:hypothetical protein